VNKIGRCRGGLQKVKNEPKRSALSGALRLRAVSQTSGHAKLRARE